MCIYLLNNDHWLFTWFSPLDSNIWMQHWQWMAVMLKNIYFVKPKNRETNWSFKSKVILQLGIWTRHDFLFEIWNWTFWHTLLFRLLSKRNLNHGASKTRYGEMKIDFDRCNWRCCDLVFHDFHSKSNSEILRPVLYGIVQNCMGELIPVNFRISPQIELNLHHSSHHDLWLLNSHTCSNSLFLLLLKLVLVDILHVCYHLITIAILSILFYSWKSETIDWER